MNYTAPRYKFCLGICLYLGLSLAIGLCISLCLAQNTYADNKSCIANSLETEFSIEAAFAKLRKTQNVGKARKVMENFIEKKIRKIERLSDKDLAKRYEKWISTSAHKENGHLEGIEAANGNSIDTVDDLIKAFVIDKDSKGSRAAEIMNQQLGFVDGPYGLVYNKTTPKNFEQWAPKVFRQIEGAAIMETLRKRITSGHWTYYKDPRLKESFDELKRDFPAIFESKIQTFRDRNPAHSLPYFKSSLHQ